MVDKPPVEKPRRHERVEEEAPKPLVSDASFGRVVKSALDLGVPGFSQYLEGDFGSGLVHTVGAIAAAVAVGPIGFWLVGANSISRSASGRNLWESGPVKRIVKYEEGD